MVDGRETPTGAEGGRSTVLVVSSQVARGSVGARAAVFALERLGHPTWVIPTVWMPWHPGQGASTRLVPEPHAFAEALAEIAESPRAEAIDTVLTGWFASPQQIEATARLIERLRLITPGLRVVVDPVIGDGDASGRGALYVAEPTARTLRDRLLPLADVATPNLFETGWLSGRPVGDTAQAIVAARALPSPLVAVTSAPALMTRAVATLLVGADGATQFEHPRLDPAPHGTGDLFAALFAARLAAGQTPEAAAARAVAAVFELVARAVRAGLDDLPLAAEQDRFVHPMAQVSIRRIAESRPAVGRRAVAKPVTLE